MALREVSMSNWKKILFSFIPLLLVITVLEVFFRIVPFHKDLNKSNAGLVIPDKDLSWRLPHEMDDKLGYSDTPIAKHTDKRILLLGDSVAWGDGIDYPEQLFSSILEKKLAAKDHKTYEVINAGVFGYATFQELRYLELYGMKLKPDMIILQFCLNDVLERYTNFAQFGGDNIVLGIDTRNTIKGVHGLLFRNFRAYEEINRGLIKLMRKQEAYRVENLVSDKLDAELLKAWDLTLSELDGIRAIAAKANIPLLIMIPPYRFQLDDCERKNQPQKKLMNFADEHKIPVIDLLPDFAYIHKQEKFKDVELYNDENHLSVDGHSLTAEILVTPVSDIINHRR